MLRDGWAILPVRVTITEEVLARPETKRESLRKFAS